MIDNSGIKGIVTFRLWDPEDIYKFQRNNENIVAGDLLKQGFNPISEFTQHNYINDDGLRWLRGQVTKNPLYGSLMGEMDLWHNGVSLGTVKRLIVSTGYEPGMLIQDAWWDLTESVGTVDTVRINTYIDGTCPPEAIVINYAYVNGLNIPKPNTQTLTVTRYEYLRRA